MAGASQAWRTIGPRRMSTQDEAHALEQEVLVPADAPEPKQSLLTRCRALCSSGRVLAAMFVAALLAICVLLLASMGDRGGAAGEGGRRFGGVDMAGVDKLGAGLFLVYASLLRDVIAVVWHVVTVVVWVKMHRDYATACCAML